MNYTDLYNKIIDSLVKDGYIIIDNALDSNLYKELLKIAQDEQNFKEATISSNKTLDKNRRRDKIRWLEYDNSTQSKFLEFSDGLKTVLNKELFLGIKYYEAHLAIYNSGDFYEKHFDSFKNSKNRVVTTVYYLNENWHKDDGGELAIYDKNGNFLKEVLPKVELLNMIMSEEFPHEVKPANKKRYSIAGWFRIDEKI